MTESVRPPAGARPLQLAPFRALRYCPDRVPRLAALTCPPYDVIGESGVSTWEAADPHNVVRLILPRGRGDDDRYGHAARVLRAWLDTGVLCREPEHALYVYEQSIGGASAVGLVGAVSLHDPAERVILPHEDVFSGLVDDRTALMTATGAQLEPILLTYEGGGAASDAVDAELTTEPFLAVTTADGASHRIWRLGEPRVLSTIAADLADRQAMIADGHHRYAAYRAVTVTRQFGPDGTRGLAMLVDVRRHPLRLSGIHRSVSRLSLADAVSAAHGAFRAVTRLSRDTDVAAALAAAGRHGAAYAVGDGRDWVLLADPDRAVIEAGLPADRSPTWRRLDASIACEVLLPRLWRVPDSDPRVAYHHSIAGAVDRARRHGGIALVLNPARHEDVLTLAARGERMPRKSTSFGPKPRTGLLMRLITDQPGRWHGPAAGRN